MEQVLAYARTVRERHPLVHCLTNQVTVNECANVLLAAGASPTMAQHEQEVEEITAACDALVCNLGATQCFEAMKLATVKAAELEHPIVIDPVGVGGSTYRRTFFEQLVRVTPTCVRGNFSEIQALALGKSTVTGVDAAKDSLLAQEKDKLVMQFAKRLHCIVIASGAVDILSDGREILHVDKGDAMLTRITGSGCMSSALLGAYLASNTDKLQAAWAACMVMGECGEKAARKVQSRNEGTMSFLQYLIDEISLY